MPWCQCGYYRPRRHEQHGWYVQRQQHGTDPGYPGATKTDAPIVQASHGAQLLPDVPAMMLAAPNCTQVSPSQCTRMRRIAQPRRAAIEQNFTSVMMDGSLKDDARPRGLHATTCVTREVDPQPTRRVPWRANSAFSAHSKPAWVEGGWPRPRVARPQPTPDGPGPGQGWVRKTKVVALR